MDSMTFGELSDRLDEMSGDELLDLIAEIIGTVKAYEEGHVAAVAALEDISDGFEWAGLTSYSWGD